MPENVKTGLIVKMVKKEELSDCINTLESYKQRRTKEEHLKREFDFCKGILAVIISLRSRQSWNSYENGTAPNTGTKKEC